MTEVFRDRRESGAGVRGGIVDFESIARAQHGGFGNGRVAKGHEAGRGFVPLGFGNGEAFADFDRGVVNGETDDVDLEAFAGLFEALLGGWWCVREIPPTKNFATSLLGGTLTSRVRFFVSTSTSMATIESGDAVAADRCCGSPEGTKATTTDSCLEAIIMSVAKTRVFVVLRIMIEDCVDKEECNKDEADWNLDCDVCTHGQSLLVLRHRRHSIESSSFNHPSVHLIVSSVINICKFSYLFVQTA